jgi:hypothetical protein
MTAVAATEWLSGYPNIVFVILLFVTLTTIPIMVAMNQADFLWRLPFNALAPIIAFLAEPMIRGASHSDPAPERLKPEALQAGVVAWVVIREVMIVLLNLLDRMRRTS